MTAVSARLSPETRAGLWMVLTAASFALGLVAIRALAPKFPPSEILLFRAAVGVALMAPWLARPGAAALAAPNRWLYAAAGLAACVGIGSWNWAVPRMPLADATALNFTLPLFTVLFAVALLGEAVGVKRFLVTVAGFAGVLVILRPGFAEVSPAALVALANPAAFAAAVMFIKLLSRSVAPGIVTFNMHLAMVPVALAANLAEGWVTPGVADLPWVVAIGLFGVLAYLGVIRALALTDASVYAAFDFLRLPAATLVAVALFGERPDLWTWLGAAVILAATWSNARLDPPSAG